MTYFSAGAEGRGIIHQVELHPLPVRRSYGVKDFAYHLKLRG